MPNTSYTSENLSSVEKAILLETTKVIVHLSNKAYSLGVLSLEEDIPSLHPFLLRKGIELIIDGCCTGELKNNLNNYIEAGQYSETGYPEGMIISEGVISIQKGERGGALFKKLLSMLGEDLLKYYSNTCFCVGNTGDIKPKVNQHISIESDIFEDRIMQIIDPQYMEKLIMKTGYYNMALALKGCSSKAQAHVKMMSSWYIKNQIDYTMKMIGPCRLKDVLDAQVFILRVL